MIVSDYWKKRQEEKLIDILDSIDVDYLNKLYYQSSVYLNDKMQGIFDTFKTKNNLSIPEAKKLLNSLENRHDYDELLRKLRNSSGTERKELLKKLDAPAYKYRIKKLQDQQQQIDMLMRNIYDVEKEHNTNSYINTAYKAHYRDVYNLQQYTNVAYEFNRLDPSLVDKMLKSKWSGKNYSKRIWGNTSELADILKEEMMMGLLAGKTEREMQDSIAERFSVGAYKARRLIETESAAMTSFADQQAFEDAGITNEIFRAVHDFKTSKICQRHDGIVVEVGKGEIGKNIPPLHPYCRSIMVPYIEGITDNMKRRQRDPVTGKDEIVDAKETYDQWLKRQQDVHGIDTVETFQKKTSNLSSDKKQFTRYKDVLGDEFIDSLAKFQDLKYNDVDGWGDLKKKYRVVNQYDVVSGKMKPSQIIEFNERLIKEKDNFTGKVKNGGNITLATFDGKNIIAHSKIQKSDSDNFKRYTGDYIVALLKDKRAFETKVIGWDRMVDGEAKIFEHIHTLNNDDNPKILNILTSFPMCDSCKDVMEQFKKLNSNVTVNLIQKKVRKRGK